MEERNSYSSGTTWGWINYSIFIFGWTNHQQRRLELTGQNKMFPLFRVQTRPFTRQRQSRSVWSERSGEVTDEEESTSVALTLRGFPGRVTTPCQMLWVSSWLTFQIWWPECPPSKSRSGLQLQTQKRWVNTWASGPPCLIQFHCDLPLYGYRSL